MLCFEAHEEFDGKLKPISCSGDVGRNWLEPESH